MIPLINLAQVLALRGHEITILTTSSNAKLLPQHLNVHTLDFSSDQVGLPPGLENSALAQDNVTVHKVLMATQLLKPQIETFIKQNLPQLLISDFMYTWSSQLGIPTMLFTPMPIFVDCIFEAIFSNSQPHQQSLSNSLPFLVPGSLPHTITLDFNPLSTPGFHTFAKLFLQAKHNNTHGIIVNSFVELEDGYTQIYQKLSGVKVWHVGMTSLMLNYSKQRGTAQKD